MRTCRCVEGIQCRVSRKADLECGGVLGRKASFSETRILSLIASTETYIAHHGHSLSVFQNASHHGTLLFAPPPLLPYPPNLCSSQPPTLLREGALLGCVTTFLSWWANAPTMAEVEPNADCGPVAGGVFDSDTIENGGQRLLYGCNSSQTLPLSHVNKVKTWSPNLYVIKF
jgi:hypothetical protein